MGVAIDHNLINQLQYYIRRIARSASHANKY